MKSQLYLPNFVWLTGAWLASLGAVGVAPLFENSSTFGEHLTRGTVRLALVYYALAVILWLMRVEPKLVRLTWTLSGAAYLIHIACAFHFYHHWSHAEAVAHVRQGSGFGPGIYVSYLFTLLWTADVAAWWALPDWYAARPHWVGFILHAIMVFVIFNATVVFAEGAIRWVSAAGFFLIGAVWLLCRHKRHKPFTA